VIADERRLTLFSAGLLSKWGFNDGDEPDDVADWLETDGISYGDISWHPVLRRLVREHLLPALEQTVVVYDIETIHNPIRAESVDGIRVDDYYQTGIRGETLTLTPEYIEVPYALVLAAAREELAASPKGDEQ
jgi:hypothetical protein